MKKRLALFALAFFSVCFIFSRKERLPAQETLFPFSLLNEIIDENWLRF